MYIEKLPSGNYRITQTIKGKRYRLTIDHKPTKTEATTLIEELSRTSGINYQDTFYNLATRLIEAKKNTASPATIREYQRTLDNRLPEWFIDMPFINITQEDVQRCVNELALSLSPKTVKDRHSFISSVFTFYKPNFKLHTQLPKMQRNDIVVPSEADVKRVINYFKENEPIYYIPAVLGTYSMRRSEVCALSPDDIEGNVVHINKAMVEDIDKNWVIKGTKTTMSTRDIVIPDVIAEEIRKQGYIFKGCPQQLQRAVKRAARILGLKEFTFHALRHYFVAKMLELGYDMRTIQEWGGWETDATVKKVYAYSLTMKSQDKKVEISAALSNGII